MSKSLRRKIILPTLGILLILVAFVSFYLMLSISRFSVDIAQNSVRVASRGIRIYVEEFENRAAIVAHTLANNPRFIQLVRNGSHSELLEFLNATKEVNNINFFVVQDHEARVLVRTHYPGRYGDIAPTPAWEAARAGRAIATYHSSATTPMAYVTRASLYYDGEFIGVVMANLFISEPAFINRMSEVFDAEFTFYFGERAVASTLLDLDSGAEFHADAEVTEAVLQRMEGFEGQLTVNNVNFSTYYFPLVNSDGTVAGMVAAAFSREYTDTMAALLVRGVILIGLGASLVAVIILMAVISAITKPIREAAERTLQMLDAVPLMVEYWSKDLKSIGCNQAVLDFYGFPTWEEYAEFLKKSEAESPVEGYDGDDHRRRWAENIQSIFDNGHGRFEFAEPDREGKFTAIEVEGSRVTFNNEPVVVVYSRDITELKQLRKEEQRAQVAEESNRAKTLFIANVSHEIRTPMNSILGYSELALDDTISDGTREHLEKIVTNTKWLLSVINDVLDISKIESGSLELEQVPFDIQQVTEYCQSLLLANANAKGLALNINAEASKIKGKRLLGDPTKLSQICINLLSNAIKFTDKGLVGLSVALAELAAESCTLSFEFRDTGVGITDEQISRIFEPFVQADSSTTRKHGGTGLGLPITKRLIEAMGGELAVESAPGFGSKFTFALVFPTVEAEKNSSGGYPGDAAEVAKPRFAAGDILVVDDNDMNLGVMCEHLKRVGLKSSIAKDGKEAVEAVRGRMTGAKAMFDLIFMDIHMPEMDGKEAARAISGLGAGVPIIAMTAETIAQTDDAPYKSYGMKDYLSKPFTTQELWKCLLKYLKPEDAQINASQAPPPLRK